MSQKKKSLPVSAHFDIKQLSNGVYTAIAKESGAAFSNSGIINLGDLTLVFDSSETPKAADDLRRIAEVLTGHQTSFVINSHHHADHWFGNQVFAEQATIIATHNTRDLMLFYIENFKTLKIDPSDVEADLQENQKRLAAEEDPFQQAAIEKVISRLKFSLETLPILDLKLPNQTFEDKIVFYGNQRSAQLLALGEGHTRGDCFLVLPEEKIAFLGDLAFFHRQPYLQDCDFLGWKNILEEIQKSEIETFIPGHGPVGQKADLLLLSQYLNALEKLVDQVQSVNGTLDDALAQTMPDPFSQWQRSGRHRFEDNVRFLFQYLSGSENH
jgi:cyclase